MKVTSIGIQARDKNRVNVSVDGKYRFSLGVFQLGSLGIKVGAEYDEAELATFEQESRFGKLYARALEYCFMRLHSSKEVRDYLYRKTRPTRTKTGELKEGVSVEITMRVFDRLAEKGYINDQAFARSWIENRSLKKGVSKRKLSAELSAKGIDRSITEQLLGETERTDADELQKIILKKRSRYPDEQKLIAYLARQGFSYDDIKSVLRVED
ncbi:RecX family transcriptional regulator [Candidatus Saccharibacteria bacterium]|nr:RecX family transcriptional regulator [Candidatus Saccharibacteria bacterium]